MKNNVSFRLSVVLNEAPPSNKCLKYGNHFHEDALGKRWQIANTKLAITNGKVRDALS